MKIEIDPITIEQGFTQSELSVWDDCAEKWYRQFNERLFLKGSVAWALLYGTAVHANLEHFYKHGERPKELVPVEIPSDVFPTAEQDAELDYWNAVLTAQMQRYFAHYANEPAQLDLAPDRIEQVLETTFEGIKFKGKVDLICQKKSQIAIWDHKTTSRWTPEVLESWYFKFQFMFYPWLVQKVLKKKVTEFCVNVLIKPALRLKVGESVESFAARVSADMIQTPEKYFKRINLSILKGSIERFENEILRPKIDRIKLLTNVTHSDMLPLVVRNLNTNQCLQYGRPCQFLPLCTHGEAERFRYSQKPHKHSELIGDAE